jgi:DNA polymerase-1
MSLVFRAYHAMQRSGLKNSKGEPTFALFAFVNILTTLLEKEKPENIAVVFDRAEPTFRHNIYKEYKANRAAFPEDLVPQLARIKQFLDLIAIPRVEKAGFEADDIIGTFSKVAAEQKIETACLTNDKDYYQLVNDYVKLYKPVTKGNNGFNIVDIDGVYEKFGVPPEQVIDVLALIGDSSDNIPGVKGIGEKTAIPLIQKYGTIENLYEHIDEIEKPAVKKKLIEGEENARLAKFLVTIKIDVETNEKLEDLHRGKPDYQTLDKFFAEAGFFNIRKHWAEKGLLEGVSLDVSVPVEVRSENDSTNTEHRYIHVKNEKLLKEMLDDVADKPVISVDLETSSLNRQTCDIVGIALCAEEKKAYYVSVYPDKKKVAVKDKSFSDDSLFGDIEEKTEEKNEIKFKDELLPLSYVLEQLGPLLENSKYGKVGQNIKFDTFILSRFGVNVSPVVFDTMIASYLLNPDTAHNLDALSQKWLNYKPIPISSLIGAKKSEQKSMRDIEPSLIAEYAGEDADLAFRLYQVLKAELEKEQLIKLADEIEFPLIEILTQMERNGVAIDTEMLSELSQKIEKGIKELSKKIFDEAGEEFNIDSPKQLAEIMFNKMQIPAGKKTKTGFSTNVTVLAELAPFYPIAEYVLEYRQLKKLTATYIDALPKLISPETGRIHTTYNQTIASTGRLSSTEPNLQNIPIRTELGREIRRAFIPGRPDALILSADYSQVELRIMAYMSGDKNLIESFRQGLDIHSATAALLFNKSLDEVDSAQRRVAKTVNFGIMYGLGAFGLSQRLGISRNEAKSIIENYFEKYPGIKQYIDDTIKFVEEKGYAQTLLGRRRYFKNINSKNHNLKTADERAAINLPIQGTASDMLKIAMINVNREMRQQRFESLMMLQVHDELVFEALKSEVTALTELVVEQMESALPLGDVPVIVDTGTGANWLEAH